MKFQLAALTLALCGLSSYTTTAFTPGTFGVVSSKNSLSTTRLYAGIEGVKKKVDPKDNPEEYIEVFIKPPESLEPREDLDGKVVVSGWVNDKERSDQFVFDLLNNHDAVSAFDFETIVAFVDDAAFTKKRLLSRSARYNGLLDKLQIEQSSGEGALPDKEVLSGASCWVAHLDAAKLDNVVDNLQSIASVSKEAGVKNVAVLVSNAHQLAKDETIKAATDSFNSISSSYTVITVGEMDDKKKEGSIPYRVFDFADVADNKDSVGEEIDSDKIVSGKFSRDEAVRILTESLGLKSATNRCVTLKSVPTDSQAAKLIKGYRAAGYSRPQEINAIFGKGVENYDQAIADYKQKKWEEENPDPEVVRKQKEEEEKKMLEARKKAQEEFEQKKKEEIEETAREWAKREYFRKSLGGNMGMTEEEYIESVWERAMFEGDLKYRMMHGGDTDERAELAEFLAEQERKKQAALKRAQKALGDGDNSPVGAGSGDDGDDDAMQ
jgi:hypothetical protein